MLFIIGILVMADCIVLYNVVRRVLSEGKSGIRMMYHGVGSRPVSFSEKIRSVSAIIGNNVSLIEGLAPVKRYLLYLRKDIQKAEDRYTFVGTQVVFTLTCVVLFCLLLGNFNLFIVLVSLATGCGGPVINLIMKRRKMHRRIFKELPDILDLLTLLVEAGLDFGAAMNVAVENTQGVLSSQLGLALKEIKLGRGRVAALEDVARRVDSCYLSSVITSITQSLDTGCSIASTLRALSEQFRSERISMIEKVAAEAPIKMMFPMILFIFPVIFLLIFAPIVLSFFTGGW
ncbi:MAG: type II secretion system F family protein [Elusimicrobiota bacterium]